MAPSADEMNIVNGAIGQNRHRNRTIARVSMRPGRWLRLFDRHWGFDTGAMAAFNSAFGRYQQPGAEDGILQADQCGGDFGATVFEKSELRRVPNSIKFGIVRELFSRPLIWRNLPIIAQ
jgi:hypothetical protein